jgi:hypothetical protein
VVGRGGPSTTAGCSLLWRWAVSSWSSSSVLHSACRCGCATRMTALTAIPMSERSGSEIVKRPRAGHLPRSFLACHLKDNGGGSVTLDSVGVTGVAKRPGVSTPARSRRLPRLQRPGRALSPRPLALCARLAQRRGAQLARTASLMGAIASRKATPSRSRIQTATGKHASAYSPAIPRLFSALQSHVDVRRDQLRMPVAWPTSIRWPSGSRM